MEMDNQVNLARLAKTFGDKNPDRVVRVMVFGVIKLLLIFVTLLSRSGCGNGAESS